VTVSRVCSQTVIDGNLRNRIFFSFQFGMTKLQYVISSCFRKLKKCKINSLGERKYMQYICKVYRYVIFFSNVQCIILRLSYLWLNEAYSKEYLQVYFRINYAFSKEYLLISLIN
jgi:hypothetical protein